MDDHHLEALAVSGDEDAAATLLRRLRRRDDAVAIAAVRARVPLLAWAGCTFLEINPSGHRVFRHLRSGLRMVEVPAGEAVVGHGDAPDDGHGARASVELGRFLIGECLVPHVVFERELEALLDRFERARLPPAWRKNQSRNAQAAAPLGSALTPSLWPVPVTAVAWPVAAALADVLGLALPSE